MKNTASNVKSLGGLPALVNELKESIASSLAEISAASKELSKANPADIRTKCQAKKLTTPTECFKECGGEIKVTPEAKKAWEAERKAKKGAAKGKKAPKGKK